MLMRHYIENISISFRSQLDIVRKSNAILLINESITFLLYPYIS